MSRTKLADTDSSSRDKAPPPASVSDPCSVSVYYNNLYLTLVPAAVRNSYRRQRKSLSSTTSSLVPRRTSKRRSRSHSPTTVAATTAGQQVHPTLHHCSTSLAKAPSRHHRTQSTVPPLAITALPILAPAPAPATQTLPPCWIRGPQGDILYRNRLPCDKHPEALAMCNTIPDAVNNVVRDVVPRATVLGFVKIPTTTPLRRLSEVRIARVNDKGEKEESKLIVSLPPAPTLRLLRSEHWLFVSEASILKFLWDELGSVGITTDSDTGEIVEGRSGKGDVTTGNSRSIDEEDESDLESVIHASHETLQFIPRLYRHHRDSASPIGGPYSVFSWIPGTPIKALLPSTWDQNRENVNRDLGSLMAQLAELLSPNDKFGPAMAVLSPPDTEQLRVGAQGMQYTGGTDNWRTAFQSYLESVLRDGEDLHINLPYAALRAHMQRLGDSMDKIVTPRLLLVDPGNDGIHLELESESESTSESGTESVGKVRFAGLTDLSTAFFGDPLFSTIFTYSSPSPSSPSSSPSSHPSAGFIQGFTGLADADPRDTSTWQTELVEDLINAPARLLLYRALHAATAVVREYCRPAPESSRRELVARKRLSEALEALDRIKVVVHGTATAEGMGDGMVEVDGTRKCGVGAGDGVGECSDGSSSSVHELGKGDGQQRRPSGVLPGPAKRVKVENS